MSVLLEVCCGDLTSALSAQRGGAQRIELCSALPLDGLTPTTATLRLLRRRFPSWGINVLIRPREGGFVYSPEEVQQMCDEIREAREALCDGIVVGALTPDGQVDVGAMREFMQAAARHPVTFHRAFDNVRDMPSAMETLVALGVRRILTSGGAPTAEAGIPVLRSLVSQAAGRIIVMPGGGVNADNVSRIVVSTGATEIHGSCSTTLPDGRRQTDTEEVRRIIAVLK